LELSKGILGLGKLCHFKPASAVLTDESKKRLDKIAETIKKHSNFRV